MAKQKQMRFEVAAERNYGGTHGNGLLFVDGKAETDDAELAGLYRGLGFTVTDRLAAAAVANVLEDVQERDAAEAAKAAAEKK